MLTRNRTIWISAKNVLSLCKHRSRPAVIAGLLRCFFIADGYSAGAGETAQAALGRNYKALGKNYKADSFFYPPDSCSQVGLS